jgi:ribosome-binding ATPase
MRLGIIGLPQSGKTTLFNALTRGNQPITVSGGRFEVHTAVIDVPDPRLEQLSALFQPGKTTFAKVTYADIAGLEGNPGKNGLGGEMLNLLSQMDGLIHVVRCFENPSVPHPLGRVDPQRDLAALEAELLLSDLLGVERKLERLEEELRRASGHDKAALARQTEFFKHLQAALSSERPLRDLAFSPEENRIFSGHAFLTSKPLILVPNLADGQSPPELPILFAHSAAVPLQGKLEMELAQLPAEDARLFMAEYGVETLGLERLISLSYELLGLQSFFTVGKDEVRAWTLRSGASALEAAAAIHSDLQKGFIRAEVVDYSDLLHLGGLAEARARGKLRLEGRDYTVRDGEIVHIRFNL